MNLKSKLKILLSIYLTAGFLLLGAIPTVAADVQIYPASGASTPYGNNNRNTTEAGWTDNHLVGQSFVVPTGVGKITQVQLTDFKLGDTKNDGLYSVALFEGEPSAYSYDADPAWWVNRTTTGINTGVKLAQVEKIFIPGQMGGGIDRLCQASSTTAGWLMTRMKINNPDRPCPSQAEWIRMWCLLNGMDTSACYGGAPQPYYDWYNQGSLDEMVGWYQWQEKQGPTGDSEFLWQPSDSKDLPPFYYGPGGNWTSTRGGKNRISDVTLQVSLPNNTVTPGQTYFLSIQGSHTDPFRTGGSGYYDEGRYNCEGPNESGPMSFWGIQNGTGNLVSLNDSMYFCGKYNPMVANISTSNPYSDGKAYFNTFYFYGDAVPNASIDTTYLTIRGDSPPPAPANPIGTCNAGGTAATFTWDAASEADRYYIRLNNINDGNWANWLALNDFFVDIKGPAYACSGTSCSFTTGPSDSLPNLDISFCPKTSGTCSAAEFTDGPSNIVSGQPYSWSIQSVGPGDFRGGTTDWYTTTCTVPTCQVTGASCGSSTTNSIAINNINLTDSGWGATGMSVQRTYQYAWDTQYFNVPPASSYTDTGLSPNTTYIYDVGCYKDLGGGSTSYTGYAPRLTCTTAAAPPPPPPSLNNLSITLGQGAANSGPVRTSGLRSPAGGNYRNPIVIQQSLSNSNASNVGLVGATFAQTSFSPSSLSTLGLFNRWISSDFYYLTASAWLTGGFMLTYAANSSFQYYYDSSNAMDWLVPSTQPFDQGKFYVYYNGVWNGPYTPGPDQLPYSSSAFTVEMDPFSNIAAGPRFTVTLKQDLGSKTWGTLGHLVNSSSTESYQNYPTP